MNLKDKINEKLGKKKICCYSCKSYSSIPHDIGLIDYCLIKRKFIKNVRRYCDYYKYEERK